MASSRRCLTRDLPMPTIHLDLAPYLRQEEGQFFDRKSLFHGPPGRKRPRDRKEVRDEIAAPCCCSAPRPRLWTIPMAECGSSG